MPFDSTMRFTQIVRGIFVERIELRVLAGTRASSRTPRR